MIYLNLAIGFTLFSAFLLILMSIVEGKIRDRQNEKIIWRIEEMDKINKRDKVVTRTGGLAHDRIYDTILDEDIIMDDMEVGNNKK